MNEKTEDSFAGVRNILFPRLSSEQIHALQQTKLGAYHDVEQMRVSIRSVGIPIFADLLKKIFEADGHTIGPLTEANFLNLQLRTMKAAEKLKEADPDILFEIDYMIIGVHLLLVQCLQEGADDAAIHSDLNHFWKNRIDELGI